MKLYLSSYKFGNSPENLTSLALDNRRAAIVMNAADVFGPERRPQHIEANRAQLAELGFDGKELDLRNYFKKPDELVRVPGTYGLVWVVGGNAFVLRRAMHYGGFDKIVKERVLEGSLVYAGFSAGTVVATPTLRGLELDDDPNVIPDRYKSEVIFDGLGLVDYSVAPHCRSDHPESPAIEKVVQFFKDQRMPYKALHDGEAIVVDGDQTRIAR